MFVSVFQQGESKNERRCFHLNGCIWRFCLRLLQRENVNVQHFFPLDANCIFGLEIVCVLFGVFFFKFK